MSYRGPEILAWEKKLADVFIRVDTVLEERHGTRFPLRPNRPPHGSPAAPQYDGLFNVGAAYSHGIGSQLGPGYVVELRLATPKRVPDEIHQQLLDEVADLLRKELPVEFPGRTLHVSRDGSVYKIHGELSLR